MIAVAFFLKALLTLVVGLAVIVVVILVALTKKRPEDSPPTANLGIPFIGNYIEFAKNPVHFIETGLKNYGKVFTVQMLHKNLTFLLGTEAAVPFFSLPDDKMSQSEVYGFMTPVFGKGIVYDAEPKKRAQQMQCVGQGLRSNRLKDYVPKIEKETLDYLKEKWGKSGTINLLDTLSELTILTSSRCLHGDDVRENLFAEVARIYYDLDKGVTPISFFFPYAPIEAHRRRDSARREMVEIFTKVIEERRKSGATQENRSDILQMYIDFKYKDGTGLTDDQVVGLLIALLFAGQHTSSITSTWTAILLLHHPEELQKVLKEQEEVLEGSLDTIGEQSINFDQVAKMSVLQNASKEALRMYPPLIMLMRMALEDFETTCDGKKYFIPKGDLIFTSPAVSSRLPEAFPQPDNFIPDRFLDPAQEKAFLGFGGGRHQCLGQQFGLLQVKTILSIIFRNYKFELCEKEVPEPDYAAMVVGPKNRLMVKYERLTKM